MSLRGEKRRRRPELNLVPLIDVLVMLVFFAFVTMQFKSSSTLNITPPKMDTAGKNVFKGSANISIDKDGVITFATNGTPERRVEDAQLVVLLKQLADIDKQIPVLIRADGKATLDRLALVLDECRKAGLKNALQVR